MNEFQNKNDYSCIVFDSAGFLCKYTFVGDLYKFSQFLNTHERFRNWTAINVYVRRSGRFMMQVKKGDFVVAKPRF